MQIKLQLTFQDKAPEGKNPFSLELPPYRPPRILQTLYTSLIDRTMYVLWRAIVFALPAGAEGFYPRGQNHPIGLDCFRCHALE